jgi:hypothetical protein
MTKRRINRICSRAAHLALDMYLLIDDAISIHHHYGRLRWVRNRDTRLPNALWQSRLSLFSESVLALLKALSHMPASSEKILNDWVTDRAPTQMIRGELEVPYVKLCLKLAEGIRQAVDLAECHTALWQAAYESERGGTENIVRSIQ